MFTTRNAGWKIWETTRKLQSSNGSRTRVRSIICFFQTYQLLWFRPFNCNIIIIFITFISSVRSSYSRPDLLLIHHPPHHPLFQITLVLNTILSLSEPLQLYKGHKATGWFFNWSARFSVPKWKKLLSQWGAFLHWKFREKLVLVGCNLFFILVLKIGRTS